MKRTRILHGGLCGIHGNAFSFILFFDSRILVCSLLFFHKRFRTAVRLCQVQDVIIRCQIDLHIRRILFYSFILFQCPGMLHGNNIIVTITNRFRAIGKLCILQVFLIENLKEAVFHFGT